MVTICTDNMKVLSEEVCLTQTIFAENNFFYWFFNSEESTHKLGAQNDNENLQVTIISDKFLLFTPCS